MGFKVVLYDPEEEVFPILSDIFSVTGHELYYAKTREKVLTSFPEDSNILILPYKDLPLLFEVLKERPIIPVFIVKSKEEEEKIVCCGFNHLNIVYIPFNPLELLNQLFLIDNSAYTDFEKLGFLNTLLKALQEEKEIILTLNAENKECKVSSYPLSSSCDIEQLKNILSENYKLKIAEGSKDYEHTYENVSELLKKLIEEKVEEKVEVFTGILSLHEVVNVVWREYSKGIFRKNLYILTLNENFRILVNLDSILSLPVLNSTLRKKGLTLKDINVIIITDFEPYNAEVLRRILAINPNVNLIGRRKVGEILNLCGIRGIKFRAVEDFPFLSAKLPTGNTLKFVIFDYSPSEPSLAFGVEEYKLLFTGKILGNFNTEDKSLMKTFHRIYFPCSRSLKNNLRKVKENFGGYKVFPYTGIPYENTDEAFKTLENTDCGLDFEYVEDKDISFVILNKVLITLKDEERRRLMDSLAGIVEFEDSVPVELLTSPDTLIEEILRNLREVVNTKESYFSVLKEIDKYSLYIPPPEL